MRRSRRALHHHRHLYPAASMAGSKRPGDSGLSSGTVEDAFQRMIAKLKGQGRCGWRRTAARLRDGQDLYLSPQPAGYELEWSTGRAEAQGSRHLCHWGTTAHQGSSSGRDESPAPQSTDDAASGPQPSASSAASPLPTALLATTADGACGFVAWGGESPATYQVVRAGSRRWRGSR